MATVSDGVLRSSGIAQAAKMTAAGLALALPSLIPWITCRVDLMARDAIRMLVSRTGLKRDLSVDSDSTAGSFLKANGQCPDFSPAEVAVFSSAVSVSLAHW